MLTRADQGLLQPKLKAQWAQHCAVSGQDVHDATAWDKWYRDTLFSLVHVRSTRDMDATLLHQALERLSHTQLGFSDAQNDALCKVGRIAWDNLRAKGEDLPEFSAWLDHETAREPGCHMTARTQRDFDRVMSRLAIEANDDYWMFKTAAAAENRMRWQIKRFMRDLECLVGHAVNWTYIQGIYAQAALQPSLGDCPAPTLLKVLQMLDTHVRRMCRDAGIRPCELPTAALTGGEAVPSNGVVGHDHQMHRVAEMADAPRPQAPASGQPGHGGEAAGSSPAPVPNSDLSINTHKPNRALATDLQGDMHVPF